MGDMNNKVLALGCHPDDIEFMMAGTLFLLKSRGWQIHYMNLANGCYGSVEYSKEDTVRIRRQEAIEAAELLGAEYYESIADDLSVFYIPELIKKVTAVIRKVSPDVLLLPSNEDYMEDHAATSKIGVSAAFSKGIPNYKSIPEIPAVCDDIAVYHAMPYGLNDVFGNRVRSNFYIDIGEVIEEKTEMLACHRSQKRWLDESQGVDSYLETMKQMSRIMGEDSGRYGYAEGWRRHNHLGFSSSVITPLEELFER